jgi:hypothetical protein
MADIHKISRYVIDLAERLEDVADAAQGRGRRASSGTRFLVLPAAGAALYALVKSDGFARRTKDVVNEARTRASDLPNDLLKSVRQTQTASQRSGSGSGSQGRNGTRSRSKTTSRRKTTSSSSR